MLCRSGRFSERLEARWAGLSAHCAATGVRYVRADTTTPVADLLFGRGEEGLRALRGFVNAQQEVIVVDRGPSGNQDPPR